MDAKSIELLKVEAFDLDLYTINQRTLVHVQTLHICGAFKFIYSGGFVALFYLPELLRNSLELLHLIQWLLLSLYKIFVISVSALAGVATAIRVHFMRT